MDLQAHCKGMGSGLKKIAANFIPHHTQCVLWSHTFISLAHVFTLITGCQNSHLIIILWLKFRILLFASGANLDMSQMRLPVIQTLVKQKENLSSTQDQCLMVIQGWDDFNRYFPSKNGRAGSTPVSLVRNNSEILQERFFPLWREGSDQWISHSCIP